MNSLVLSLACLIVVGEVQVADDQQPTIAFPANKQRIGAGAFGAFGMGASPELYYQLKVHMPNRPNGGLTMDERQRKVKMSETLWVIDPIADTPTDPGPGATWTLELQIYDPATKTFGAPFGTRTGPYGP